MKVLLQQVRIADPSSPQHGLTQDILIESGIIRNIQDRIAPDKDVKVITGKDLTVSPGWVDVFASFGDPGYEYKETLETGSQAAAGYTDVFLAPNTKPVTDNKSQAEYITRSSATLPVNLHPIGAISKGTQGNDLAEMYDMRSSGAIAFSDGISPVQSAGILVKA